MSDKAKGKQRARTPYSGSSESDSDNSDSNEDTLGKRTQPSQGPSNSRLVSVAAQDTSQISSNSTARRVAFSGVPAKDKQSIVRYLAPGRQAPPFHISDQPVSSGDERNVDEEGFGTQSCGPTSAKGRTGLKQRHREVEDSDIDIGSESSDTLRSSQSTQRTQQRRQSQSSQDEDGIEDEARRPRPSGSGQMTQRRRSAASGQASPEPQRQENQQRKRKRHGRRETRDSESDSSDNDQGPPHLYGRNGVPKKAPAYKRKKGEGGGQIRWSEAEEDCLYAYLREHPKATDGQILAKHGANGSVDNVLGRLVIGQIKEKVYKWVVCPILVLSAFHPAG